MNTDDLKNETHAEAKLIVDDSVCNHDFVIKFGEYYCQECGISHFEAITLGENENN